MIKKIMVVILACMTLGVFIHPAAAKLEKIGMGMNYSTIKIDNLPINSSISMTKLVNLPLIVKNGGDRDIIISMKPRIPLTVKRGYEAIPDPSWIVPEKEKLLVPAKGQASMDVVINIPDDNKLLKRKFQADIYVGIAEDPGKRTGFNFNLALNGKLLFSIAPKPNQAALKQALENPADAAFDFSHPRLDFYEIKPGDSFEVNKKLEEPLFLENKSSKSQTYYLYMKEIKEATVKVDKNTQTAMNPNDVQFTKDELTIRAGKKALLDLSITVPETVDFSKGKIVYVLACKTGWSTQGVERQMPIYCSAEKKEQADKEKGK